ncbi:DUF928 domain-containing protein [Oscillatoriales cyanobacterium LEGE 11467]|uniref:DUF928 domain-containing protein n=1 Tax=Zarconia navalis LEGE 11467 TaxID=1828826 RepID=A0A928VYF3_9CYAN|nr:DUF928 domain-containing protein [Zarconia navalis]MBE9041583.1 DUF928 domain-containing protein [Zarconia navalis LEGE 11467]
MYQSSLFRFQLILPIALVWVSFLDRQPGMARAVWHEAPHPQHSIALMEPESPDTGTPQGDRTVGGTRPEATCKETEKPLTALFANNGSDLTLSEYPTFWFYVPYAPADISTIEFLLLDGSERRTIYRTTLRLNDRPGIIQVSLPALREYALEEGKTYRWRFNLDCVPDRTADPDLVLNGWIRRVVLDSLETEISVAGTLEQYQTYRDNGIWYDAIAHLAQQHFANPEDSQLSQAWEVLLSELGLDLAISEPFVDSEVLSGE